MSSIEPVGIGQWHFPDGTQVEIRDMLGALYRNRGPSVVRLNRRNNATMPTGMFHCEIEDNDEINNDIYIGIYLTENGTNSLNHNAASIKLPTCRFSQYHITDFKQQYHISNL